MKCYRDRTFITLILILVGCLFQACTVANRFQSSLERGQQYQVEIIRDKWGVPHVIGRTNSDTAYGLAFANAEDDFDTIQMVFLAARGKLAAAMGKDMAPIDYAVQLMRVWPTVDAKYNTLSSEVQSICESYADGLNCYAAKNKDQIKFLGIWPVTGKDVVAGFAYKMPLFFGLEGQLKRIADNRVGSASPKINQSKSRIITKSHNKIITNKRQR